MTARSIAHAKQIKPAGATAKLAQNSALSTRLEKGICILCCNSGSRPCELGAKQTIFQDEPGGRLQSRSQEIQQPQTNAIKTFSSQRLQCLATSLLHHGPENGIQKTSRNMAAIKGPRLYLHSGSLSCVATVGLHVDRVRLWNCTG